MPKRANLSANDASPGLPDEEDELEDDLEEVLDGELGDELDDGLDDVDDAATAELQDEWSLGPVQF